MVAEQRRDHWSGGRCLRVLTYPARRALWTSRQIARRRLHRETVERLRALRSGTATDGENYRQRMLARIVQYAQQRTPYYRDLLSGVRVDARSADWLQLVPLLDKDTIRTHGEALAVHRPRCQHVRRFNTGGTTGNPLEFLLAGEQGVVVAAHQEYCFKEMGYRPGDRIAAVDGAAIPDELLGERVYWIDRQGSDELPYGSARYSSLHLMENTAEAYAHSLSAGGFRFLLGYPSAISMLAEFYAALHRHPEIRLKGVQLTAEAATPQQVELISSAFACPVHLQYGHSEACMYGHTWDSSLMYWCSPLVGWMEVVDADGRAVPVGSEGEVVVTGFWSRAMPLIRYRTGDRAVYGGTENGFVMLRSVTGRTQDFLLRADGSRVPVTGVVYGQHFAAFGSISRWQILQSVPGRITVRVDPGTPLTEGLRREVVAKFANAALAATLEQGPLIKTPRGKHPFVIQQCGLGSPVSMTAPPLPTSETVRTAKERA